MDDSDFSWFTDGSYLKDDNSEYWTGYDIATPFNTLRQHLNLWPLQLNRLNYMLLLLLLLSRFSRVRLCVTP